MQVVGECPEAVALLVERLDDLLVEDGRGQEAFFAVDHKVEANVAAVAIGWRGVQVGNYVPLVYLLAFLDEQEPQKRHG